MTLAQFPNTVMAGFVPATPIVEALRFHTLLWRCASKFGVAGTSLATTCV